MLVYIRCCMLHMVIQTIISILRKVCVLLKNNQYLNDAATNELENLYSEDILFLCACI